MQRNCDAQTNYLTIRDDSINYINMADGNSESVQSPFNKRILVPYLASFITTNTHLSLKIITYFSLIITFIVSLLILKELGIKLQASLLSLLLVFFSDWQLSMFNNPFLIDAFYIMIVSILYFLFLKDRFHLFVFILLIGMFTKETTILFSVLWFLVDVRKGIIATSIALSIYCFLIFLYGFNNEPDSLLHAFRAIGFERINNPIEFIKDIVVSWRYLWFVFILGFAYLPNKISGLTFKSFIAVWIGVFLICFIATDVGRMYFQLYPIAIILAGFFLNQLFIKKYYWMLILLLIYALTQSIFQLPNVIEGDPTFQWFDDTRNYRIIFFASGLIILSYIYLQDRIFINESFKKFFKFDVVKNGSN